MNTPNLLNRARSYLRRSLIPWASLFALFAAFYVPSSAYVGGGEPAPLVPPVTSVSLTVSCTLSPDDTAWIASLPAEERHLAAKEARMDLLENQSEGSACAPAQTGLPTTGADPLVPVSYSLAPSVAPECSLGSTFHNNPWVLSQQGAEARLVANLLKMECSPAGSDR